MLNKICTNAYVMYRRSGYLNAFQTNFRIIFRGIWSEPRLKTMSKPLATIFFPNSPTSFFSAKTRRNI